MNGLFVLLSMAVDRGLALQESFEREHEKGDAPYLNHEYGTLCAGVYGTITLHNPENEDAWLTITTPDIFEYPMAQEMR